MMKTIINVGYKTTQFIKETNKVILQVSELWNSVYSTNKN